MGEGEVPVSARKRESSSSPIVVPADDPALQSVRHMIPMHGMHGIKKVQLQLSDVDPHANLSYKKIPSPISPHAPPYLIPIHRPLRFASDHVSSPYCPSIYPIYFIRLQPLAPLARASCAWRNPWRYSKRRLLILSQSF